MAGPLLLPNEATQILLRIASFKMNETEEFQKFDFKTDTSGFVFDIGICIQGGVKIRIEGNRDGKNFI